jgi:25S rRNA (uracil2634-N3)-methyltransferase
MQNSNSLVTTQILTVCEEKRKNNSPSIIFPTIYSLLPWYNMAKRKRHLHREGKSGDPKTKDTKEVAAAGVATNSKDLISIPDDIPIRDNSDLYAAPETIGCARKCIPCAYKIGLFDVALDTDFCRQVPNQRPEQCHRLGAKSTRAEQIQDSTIQQHHNSMGYRPGMSVLCVGDGDFSFSVALARILFPSTSSTGGGDGSSRLIATSYETEETLRSVYPNFEETQKELHDLGATTVYRVDATKLTETLSAQYPDVGTNLQFDRICWNFPCSAVEKGQDGQNDEMEHNKELVRKFAASAAALLTNGGEIHICHKTKPPYNQWKLEQVVSEGSSELLQYAGRIVLDRAVLPPYIPRKALDRKSFPCHDACIYIFQHRHSSKGAPTTFPSTIGNSSSDAPQPVTNELIFGLRGRLIRFANSKPKSKGSSRYGRSSKRFKR